MEAMKVYHLTIQENGHSRRFVYEDRDEALTRLADAIAAGLDARLDELVRHAAGLRDTVGRRKPHRPTPGRRLNVRGALVAFDIVRPVTSGASTPPGASYAGGP